MSKIIPRWEWRTFGTRFGISEEKIQNTSWETSSAAQRSTSFPETVMKTARFATT
jgi:hypothetical protein